MTSIAIYSIYRIQNTINGKVYIGYTKTPEQRFKAHKNSINRKQSNKKVLTLAFKKYGIENFSFDVIYQSLDAYHTKNIMESYFINEYNSHVDSGNGYNMTGGGDGMLNPSKETLFRIGSANRGKTRIVSPETGRKISEAKKGVSVMTEAQKQNLREKKLGIKQSEESIAKRAKTYPVRSPNGEIIIITNLCKFAREHDLNSGALNQVALGKVKQHKGYSRI